MGLGTDSRSDIRLDQRPRRFFPTQFQLSCTNLKAVPTKSSGSGLLFVLPYGQTPYNEPGNPSQRQLELTDRCRSTILPGGNRNGTASYSRGGHHLHIDLAPDRHRRGTAGGMGVGREDVEVYTLGMIVSRRPGIQREALK